MRTLVLAPDGRTEVEVPEVDDGYVAEPNHHFKHRESLRQWYRRMEKSATSVDARLDYRRRRIWALVNHIAMQGMKGLPLGSTMRRLRVMRRLVIAETTLGPPF